MYELVSSHACGIPLMAEAGVPRRWGGGKGFLHRWAPTARCWGGGPRGWTRRSGPAGGRRWRALGCGGLPPGRVSPRQATYFLCWCKESRQRKHLERRSVPPYAQAFDTVCSPLRRLQYPEPSVTRLAVTTPWHTKRWPRQWCVGKLQPAAASLRMPGRCTCQSGDRRFGDLRMPGSPSTTVADADGVRMHGWTFRPSFLVTSFWALQKEV